MYHINSGRQKGDTKQVPYWRITDLDWPASLSACELACGMQGTRKTISMLKIFADHPTKSCFRYDHAPGTSTHLATLTHSTVPTHLPDKTVSQPRTVRYRSLQHTSHTPNTDPIVLIHFPVRSVCFYPRPSELKGKAVPLQAWSGPEGSRKLR